MSLSISKNLSKMQQHILIKCWQEILIPYILIYQKVFKKILLLKQYKLIGTKKLKKLVDCPKIQHQTSPVMCQKKVSNIVWSLLFPVKREISRYSLTIP